ncbi:hypothetical protein ES708_30537 [subsurface metagenome]
MALATIDTLDTFEFDTSHGSSPTVAHVGGNIYAIAYCGADNDGWLVTVEIDSKGNIAEPVVDSFEFDTSSGWAPHILHISGDIYAIAYYKGGSGAWVITVDIDSAGSITKSTIDGLQLYSGVGDTNMRADIIHVFGDIYAILSTDAAGTGSMVYTVDIDSAGNIADTVIDTYRYKYSYLYLYLYPEIVKVFGTTYAIVYGDWPNSGTWLRTLTIANDGTMAADPTISTLEFDAYGAPYGVSIVHVTGDTYAVAYHGVDGDGWLATFTIDSGGSITAVDTLEFDEVTGTWPHIIQLSERLYAIAYSGSGQDGYLKTVIIEADGTIGSVTQSFRFTGLCDTKPWVFVITSSIVAIAYAGYGYDGYLETIGRLPAALVISRAFALAREEL